MIGKVLYCNDGDWVESCTALVEHRDGELELLHWAEMRNMAMSYIGPSDANSSTPASLGLGRLMSLFRSATPQSTSAHSGKGRASGAQTQNTPMGKTA